MSAFRAVGISLALLAWVVAESGNTDDLLDHHDSAIDVSIAVPQHDGQRSILVEDDTSHFHVLIKNKSGETKRLWREWCSWGYYALSFECVDRQGNRHVATKKPIAFKQNTPDFWTLPAGETLVIDVYPAPEEWQGFPIPPKGELARLEMRAVFEIAPDQQSMKHGVWTGKAVSESGEYVMENRSKEAP